MARYIDADALIEKYERVIKDPWNKNSAPTSWASAWEDGIADINDMPTADVVPKSEYDAVVSAVDNSTKEFLKLHDDYQKAKSEVEELVQDSTRLVQENETLKDNNEHLAVILEETKIELDAMRGAANSLKMHYEKAEAEIERLRAEKDALVKNYAECMKDYAREIFAEVNMQIFPYSTDIYIKAEELIIIPKSDYNAILAELKKKYTEGEPIPATEEKYFSPEDVRNMTPQEVREKYTAIRRSMERW